MGCFLPCACVSTGGRFNKNRSRSHIQPSRENQTEIDAHRKVGGRWGKVNLDSSASCVGETRVRYGEPPTPQTKLSLRWDSDGSTNSIVWWSIVGRRSGPTLWSQSGVELKRRVKLQANLTNGRARRDFVGDWSKDSQTDIFSVAVVFSLRRGMGNVSVESKWLIHI